MVTKGKFLLFFTIFEVGLFVLCMFVKIASFRLSFVWFSLAVFFVGQYALLYSRLYKLDSSLYYGVLLILIAISSAYQFYSGYGFGEYYPIYIICFALSDFAVFVNFRQNIHFKMFAILLSEAILLLCYKTNYLKAWWLLIINGLFILFIIIQMAFRVRRNLRRIK